VLETEGMVESPAIFFDRDAFWVNGKQVAGFVDGGALALRPGRRLISEHRARLKADPRIELRASSDWITFRFSRAADLALIAELAELTAAAYRAPPGSTPQPPPSGAKLARMRRFH
jgi:hypothetical protein